MPGGTAAASRGSVPETEADSEMEPSEPRAKAGAEAQGGARNAKVEGQTQGQGRGQGGKWVRRAGRFDGASDWEWV